VGSGREVARLTRQHDAYRWICGGVSVNYRPRCRIYLTQPTWLAALTDLNIWMYPLRKDFATVLCK
jgi:hypothetical protein